MGLNPFNQQTISELGTGNAAVGSLLREASATSRWCNDVCHADTEVKHFRDLGAMACDLQVQAKERLAEWMADLRGNFHVILHPCPKATS